MKKFICLFKGHDFQFRYYDRPWTNYLRQNVTHGFFHFGILTTCQRCGKTVDAENDHQNLSLLQPEFTNTKPVGKKHERTTITLPPGMAPSLGRHSAPKAVSIQNDTGRCH